MAGVNRAETGWRLAPAAAGGCANDGRQDLEHVPLISDHMLTSWPGLSSQVGFTRLATLYTAVHVFIEATKDVDARDKRGHDGRESDSI